MPTIGIMHSGSANKNAKQIDAFLKSLELSGYTDGLNVTIPPHLFADDDRAMLPTHASTWVTRHVDVLVAAGGSASSEAAQAATAASGTSVVFTSVADPVRPAANMTGICARTSELDATRLNLLHELMPASTTIGALTNPSRSKFSTQWPALLAAAGTFGVNLPRQDVNPPPHPTPAQIDAMIVQAFEAFRTAGTRPVLVTADPLFNNHRQTVVDAARTKQIPAIYQWREFADAGGLMSYGPKLTDAYKLAGIYVGRILDGASPSSLPVTQLTSFELVINLRAASGIGIVIPETLLARADHIIV
jgi:putative ABC transport system substrate-binding protein